MKRSSNLLHPVDRFVDMLDVGEWRLRSDRPQVVRRSLELRALHHSAIGLEIS